MASGGDDREALRVWAIALAVRCVRVKTLSDTVLVCQIADALVSYVLTGHGIAESLPPGDSLH